MFPVASRTTEAAVNATKNYCTFAKNQSSFFDVNLNINIKLNEVGNMFSSKIWCLELNQNCPLIIPISNIGLKNIFLKATCNVEEITLKLNLFVFN